MVSFTAAKAGIQNFKAFDKTGLLPRAGMASGAIRLKCYTFSKKTISTPMFGVRQPGGATIYGDFQNQSVKGSEPRR